MRLSNFVAPALALTCVLACSRITAQCTIQASVNGPINSPNNVPDSASALGNPVLGSTTFALVGDDPTGACGLRSGINALFLLSVPAAPVTIPLPGGCNQGGLGDALIRLPAFGLLGPRPWSPGAPAVVPVPIPSNPNLCGARARVQVVFWDFIRGTLHPGSALDLQLGS